MTVLTAVAAVGSSAVISSSPNGCAHLAAVVSAPSRDHGLADGVAAGAQLLVGVLVFLAPAEVRLV